jgi:hypothetical protein
MGKQGKQSARNADKKASKREEEDEPAGSTESGALLKRVKTLALQSCLLQTGPKLKDILQNDAPAAAPAQEKAEEKDDKENEETKEDEGKEETAEKKDGDAATALFEAVGDHLHWSNVLGLGEPTSGDAAKQAWLDFKGLEIDWGPRAKRNANPGLDRILMNVPANLPQYLHILLALMVLRAFLFRSFFACLPWLVFYQILSLYIWEYLEKLPQVPTEKAPVKFRAAGTLAIHALMWLFFLWEAVYKTYILEKIPLIGLFVYHAYAVRPKNK